MHESEQKREWNGSAFDGRIPYKKKKNQRTREKKRAGAAKERHESAVSCRNVWIKIKRGKAAQIMRGSDLCLILVVVFWAFEKPVYQDIGI